MLIDPYSVLLGESAARKVGNLGYESTRYERDQKDTSPKSHENRE